MLDKYLPSSWSNNDRTDSASSKGGTLNMSKGDWPSCVPATILEPCPAHGSVWKTENGVLPEVRSVRADCWQRYQESLILRDRWGMTNPQEELTLSTWDSCKVSNRPVCAECIGCISACSAPATLLPQSLCSSAKDLICFLSQLSSQPASDNLLGKIFPHGPS